MKKGFIQRNRVVAMMLTIMLAALFCPVYGVDNTAAQPADKESIYKEHLKKGDGFLAARNYAAAMFEYEKASELMPFEDEPKLKMQSIEATLGEKELAEVKKKVEQARKLEQDQLKQSTAVKPAEPKQEKADISQFIRERESQTVRDSLRKAIFNTWAEELRLAEKGNDMLARSKVYRSIADAFRKVKDEEIAINYYQKAIEIEEKYGEQKNVSTVYEEIADAYYSSGDFQNSLTSFEKSLSLKEKSGDKPGASKVMSDIANVYETTYDYKNAINYYQQSARIKDSIKDESGLKDVMNDLGDVYYKQKVLTSSILSYEKTVNLIQKLKMNEALGPVYNKMGVAHYEMGNYTEAEKFFKESMKNLNESGNRKEASMALNNIGNLLYINNKYNDAITYYTRSLSSKKESNYDFGKAVTYFNLGNAYRRSGNQQEAVKYFEMSRRIADSLNIISLSAKNIKALAVSYEASKNFEKAAALQEELNLLDHASVSIEIPISENEMDLEIEKTQEILSKLSEEALKRKDLAESGADKKMTDLYINNLNKQYLKEQQKTRLLVILAISLGAILLITVFLFRRSKSRIKARKESKIQT